MQILPSSYRDTDGFVFEKHGQVYRFIHPRYETHYNRLMKSGLYNELVLRGWLIAHGEIDDKNNMGLGEGRVIHPEQIPFISYPYEWSFAMWQDAALLTLKIAIAALENEIILKDATPFNIQFSNGRPVFIDTLSFENYEPGKPWIAYRQFCECFLAPLLLMHYCHPSTNKLFTVYPNGIPLDVLSSLLPKRSRWNVNTFLHIHLQSKITGNKKQTPNNNKLSKQKLEILLKGLTGYVQKLSPKKIKTNWDDYYTDTISRDNYLLEKTKLVHSFYAGLEFTSVIDLGANNGHFSLLFDNKKTVIATDADPNCINSLYLKIKKEKISNILPLVIDLITPSPAIGWNNAERDAISKRLKARLVLALALVHHLAITNNVPFRLIADWLGSMTNYLIIEFIPRDDEKVKLMLQNREDIFEEYTPENFKATFSDKFQILKEKKIGNTNRILYLMKRK